MLKARWPAGTSSVIIDCWGGPIVAPMQLRRTSRIPEFAARPTKVS